MGIIIGADVVPTNSNRDLFIEGNVDQLVGSDLANILREADFRICNVETPLTDDIAPIKKCGPALQSPAKAVKGYSALGIDLVTLANNHIKDQGSDGIMSTITALRNVGISYIGAGEKLDSIESSSIVEVKGKHIGVYACTEHEFSIADSEQAGANPFDPDVSLFEVRRIKESCEYLIVLYHGGKELYRYPSPNLQDNCRALINAGADIVICQHTHCIGCEERYHSGKIIYGQGNFIFDLRSNEYWNSGMLVEIDDELNVKYILFTKQSGTIRMATGDDYHRIMNGFKERSEEIKQPGFVRNHYKEYANGLVFDYLEKIQGKKSLFYKIGKRIKGQSFSRWYLRRKYGESDILNLVNTIECEPHRELVLAGLKQMY